MNESAEFDTTVVLPKIQNGRTEDFQQIPNRSQEQDKSILDTELSRRKVAKAALLATFGIVGGLPVIRRFIRSDTSKVPYLETQQVQAPQDMLDVSEQEPQDPWAEQNTILQAEIFSPERVALENAYLKDTMTLSEIDLGLAVCVEESVRRSLIGKRWELRKSGVEGMTQLSAEQIQFCREHEISNEILGMCLDTYEDAKNIIAQLQDELREDSEGKAVDPEMLMINAGGLAKLIMTETSGFLNPGKKKAITQFGEDNIVYDTAALKELTSLLSENTGLNFDPNNIAGSEFLKQDGNTSGGAIGIQFMPSRALEYYRKLQKTGEIGNIFDPIQSIKMAWTFLACHEQVIPGEPTPEKFRYGYLRGNEPHHDRYRYNAIDKWNSKEDQIQSIKQAAEIYSDRGL
ncbi:MAG TPA: hypothetical protein PLD54_01600 [Candidatus Levybacteria bacterium]|mgnify:CR=1 FL=1|nr:hypothetical protein [Candidatus Levybacteria bacterium]